MRSQSISAMHDCQDATRAMMSEIVHEGMGEHLDERGYPSIRHMLTCFDERNEPRSVALLQWADNEEKIDAISRAGMLIGADHECNLGIFVFDSRVRKPIEGFEDMLAFLAVEITVQPDGEVLIENDFHGLMYKIEDGKMIYEPLTDPLAATSRITELVNRVAHAVRSRSALVGEHGESVNVSDYEDSEIFLRTTAMATDSELVMFNPMGCANDLLAAAKKHVDLDDMPTELREALEVLSGGPTLAPRIRKPWQK